MSQNPQTASAPHQIQSPRPVAQSSGAAQNLPHTKPVLSKPVNGKARAAALNAQIVKKRMATDPVYARTMASRARFLAQQKAAGKTPVAARPAQTTPAKPISTRPVQGQPNPVRSVQGIRRPAQLAAGKPASRSTAPAPQPALELGVIEEYHATRVTTVQPATMAQNAAARTAKVPKPTVAPAVKPTAKPATNVDKTPATESGDKTKSAADPGVTPTRPNWPFLKSIQVEKRPLSGGVPPRREPLNAEKKEDEPVVSSVVLNSISAGKKSKVPVVALLILTILLGIAAGAAIYFCIFGA